MSSSRFTNKGSSRSTDEGITVIKLAYEEARRMGHRYVGSEQLLLGLIAHGTSISAKVLISTGITLKDARVEVEKMIGRGDGVSVPLRVLERTPAEKRALRYTLEEAGPNYIGSQHWLLGLLGEDECVAVRVLENLGADPTKIRTQVIQIIAETTETAYFH